jgi:hypothetical protein
VLFRGYVFMTAFFSAQLSPSDMVEKLRKAFASALDFARNAVLINADDRVGPVHRLKLPGPS